MTDTPVPGDRLRMLLRGLGQTMITAGVVVLLFCVYELQVTGLYTAQQQDKLGDQLVKEWDRPAPRAAEKFDIGSGIARIYFPGLGKDQVKIVVEGIDRDALKKGPGHYPGTALPGQIGNVVVSGHRTTYGAPFSRLDELPGGGAIVLETRTHWFTYRVIDSLVVSPSAIGVTYPVPDHLGAAPTQRLLTLTTCHPKYSARTRLVVHALLEAQLAKAPGVRPPALEA